MLPPPRTKMEEIKQREFYKLKIKEAWSIVDIKNEKIQSKKEISYVMRYLNQFPSEAQVRSEILKAIEEDEPSDNVKYEKFEPKMLEWLMKNQFKPATHEELLAAFKVLDPDNKGYIREDEMKNLLMNCGIKFDVNIYKEFYKFAVDKDGTKIYYEEYVAKLIEENEQHLYHLIKDYDTFKPS